MKNERVVHPLSTKQVAAALRVRPHVLAWMVKAGQVRPALLHPRAYIWSRDDLDRARRVLVARRKKRDGQ